MKKIIIYILTFILVIITTILIVLLYSKYKSNYITCNLLYKDENYIESSKIKIFYKNNKVINYIENVEINSDDKDLLKFISSQYKKEKYKVEIKNKKMIAIKELTTKLKYNELIKEYTKVGYNCK